MPGHKFNLFISAKKIVVSVELFEKRYLSYGGVAW